MTILAFVELCLAVSALSLTFTQSHMGKAMQKVLAERSKMLGLLFSCPYCISHWFAFMAVCFYDPTLSLYWAIITMFAIVGGAALVSGAIRLLSKLIKQEGV